MTDSDTVRGTVRVMAQHTVGGVFPTEAVSFGLERLDSTDDALPPILVEFRARRVTGRLDDGDEVEVTGTWKNDVLYASRIINHSRGTQLQGRWLGWAEGRVGILTLVAGLSIIAAVTATVIVFTRDGNHVNGGSTRSSDTDPRDVTVDGATVISFGGTPDNPELADLAIDGDSDTAWPTDPYKKPDAIPRYKNGVGLLLQLSEATTLSAVTVDVSSSGTEVQIRSARSALPTTLSDTTALTASTRVWPGINTIEITSSTRTSYVLVWVTKLGTTEGKNVATISEITLQGPG